MTRAAAAALLAAALAGSAPAGAANTASEFLVDRADRLAEAPQDGIRPFAGRDRHETSVLLAERFAQRRGGLGSVPTVVLVSGEAPADGLVSAGLAGQLQAPILLTRRDALPVVVADFIDRHDVSTVIAVGGPESISVRVLADVAAVGPRPEVRRIGGEDRFATAAAVAAELHGAADWCGGSSGGSTAVLVNGSDSDLKTVVGIGPLAFARELPVVLTGRDELPAATAKYLRQQRIDRVVVVGSERSVADAVLSPILAAGVDEIARVAADSPIVTEAAIAELMTVTCRHELGPSPSLVALADRSTAVDAVAAAPLLGVGIDGTGPVPMLLADDGIPLSARQYLARTPREVDGRKSHMQVVAIGGLAAVDEATMSAAVRAAASAPALTARISAAAGDRTLRVSYSEILEADAVRFIGRLRDVLYVNGAPAWIAGQPLVGSRSTDPCEMFSTVDVTLNRELEAGDVIQLETADGWHSTNGDRRDIQGVTHTVPEPRALIGTPSVEVMAQPRESTLWVSVRADVYRDPDAGADGAVTIRPGRIRVLAEDGTPVTVGQATLVRVDRFLGTALHAIPLQHDGGSYALAPGDRVLVRNGLAVTSSGQRSGSRRVTVTEPDGQLRIAAVRVGPPNPGVDDSAATTRPDEIATISRRAQASLGGSLSIVADWSGAAAGAAGNAWEIYSTRADRAAGVPRDDPPSTQVWVDTSRHVITIRHVNAPAGEEREQTYGELVRLLNSDRSFSRHFTAELSEPCEGDDEVVDLGEDGLTGTVELSGGISSVSFLVTFSDYVKDYVSDGATVADASVGDVGELIDDILGGLIADYGDSVAGIAADRVEAAAPAPGKEMVFRFTTEDPDHTVAQQVSIRGNRIDIRSGVAAGFGIDDPETADTDEGVNAGRALFAVASRDARLLSDLPRGTNPQ